MHEENFLSSWLRKDVEIEKVQMESLNEESRIREHPSKKKLTKKFHRLKQKAKTLTKLQLGKMPRTLKRKGALYCVKLEKRRKLYELKHSTRKEER